MALRAKVSSCTILARVNEIIFIEPSAFLTVSLTSVPSEPRMSFTASSTIYPVKSTGSLLPCATFRIISPTCISPDFQAGVPVTKLAIFILPSSYANCAPMPKNVPLICSSK